jgi:hypothetical protein
MASIGSGLGSAGFIVVGTDVDPVAVAAGVSHFLAVESCGQCTPCKQDGSEIAQLLSLVAAGNGGDAERALIQRRLSTVADGARCGLASQQEVVVGSILHAFGDQVAVEVGQGAGSTATYVIAPLRNVGVEGTEFDLSVVEKQLDWSMDPVDSGRSPVDRMSPQQFVTAPSNVEGFGERP